MYEFFSMEICKIDLIHKCYASGIATEDTTHLLQKSTNALNNYVEKHFSPNTVFFDKEKSTSENFVFLVNFIHTKGGNFPASQRYIVTVKPSFCLGFIIRIKGKDVNGSKMVIEKNFNKFLMTEIEG